MWMLSLALPALASTGVWIGTDLPTAAQSRHVHKVTGEPLDWSTRPDLAGVLEDQANVCVPRFDKTALPDADWVALDIDGDVVVWRVDTAFEQLNRHGKSWAPTQLSRGVVLVEGPDRGVPSVREVAKAVDGPVTVTDHHLSQEALEQLMQNPYECLNPSPLAARDLSGVQEPVYLAAEARGHQLFVWRWDGGDEPFRLVSR